MAGYPKPLPDITPESRPFWEGCRRHEFLLQRCRDCGAFQHYPRGVCARCWGANLEWRPSAGRGRIYTFTVTHRTQARGFRDETPYVLAWIELDEGVQVLGNVVGSDPALVAIGMPVRVTFEDVTPEVTLPRFAPAA
ncbi:MAG TPA: Zn-ribbon domain-containing OB-fold protein [Methylomirabilota bacterium]|nr:Zn-ribbon domain-containing OB-fold protein [Methylomirabilota bacterium]